MDESLSFETHLKRQKRLYGYADRDIVSERNREHIESRAQYDHALTVWDPLRELATQVTFDLPSKLSNQEAQIYMRHGVGRRLHDMFDSYRDIVLTAYEDRTETVRIEEKRSLSRGLNSFYINLRGVLDNLAFCWISEREPERATKLDRTAVDFFSKKFRTNVPSFKDVEGEILKHDKWILDLKSRRDPAAHRIPLYLPPALVTEEEGKRMQELVNASLAAAVARQFEECNRLSEQADRIGCFFPAFLHHPGEAAIPIYPTIPEDAGHVIGIGRAVCEAIAP